MRRRRWCTAQALIEYILLIVVIAGAMVAMFPRIKRTSQSLMKTAADQIGDQKGAEQNFNTDDPYSSYLVWSNTATSTTGNTWRRDVNGVTDKTLRETTRVTTQSLVNSGFTED